MARPRAVIDYDAVEKLAHLQCTQKEIASFLELSVRTLQRDEEFCRLYKKGLESGKMSLRRMQWRKAEEGNGTMLIWLGKQYLGQREEPADEQANDALNRLVTALENSVQSETEEGN